MTKKLIGFLIFDLFAAPSIAAAEPPQSALFIGAGGSYNAAHIDQKLLTGGALDILDGGLSIASGALGGPAAPFDARDNRLAPLLQAGYFSHFPASPWLWGFKFNYQYVGAEVAQQGIVSPGQEVDGFVGQTFVSVGTSQVKLQHLFGLLPFIGASYGNGYIYGGGGPVLARTETNISGVGGFLEDGSGPLNLTGAPMNFSGNNWVWGGAAHVGFTYFFSSNWFIDLNYTFTRLQKANDDFVGPFTSSIVVSNTFATSGTAAVSASDDITLHAVAVSVNTTF